MTACVARGLFLVHDFDLDGFHPDAVSGKEPALWFNQAVGARIRNCRSQDAALSLRVTGRDTRGIRLFANDLPHAARLVEIGKDVSRSAVR